MPKELPAKFFLATAIISLLLLFFLQQNSQAITLKISEISIDETGKIIETTGRKNWQSEKEKTLFFELYDGNSILAVKFNPSIEERKTVRENTFLKITGKVQQYKKSLEIIVDSVEAWKP